MTTLFTASFVTLAVIHLITYAAIVARHAIPRAPIGFHLALTGPMLAGVALLFLIAVVVRTGSGALFGVGSMYYITAFVWTEIGWLSVLLYYSYWWYRHGRNEE